MIRPPARSFSCAAAALALCAPLAVLLAAQPPPGSFRLPEPTPSPTPAPAGPADERAGVAIPPRPVTRPRIVPEPVLTAEPAPLPSPRSTPRASATGAAPRVRPAPAAPVSASPIAAPTAPAPVPATVPAPSDPLPLPPAPRLPSSPAMVPGPAPAAPEAIAAALPDWWPWAAGGLGALALLAGGALLRRRSQPKALRLASPANLTEADAPAQGLPHLDLALEITGATRSVMMFTLQYRLTIANRSDRAVNDLAMAVQLACARAGKDANAGGMGGNAPTLGAAQRTGQIERVGPHQARTLIGEVQLPLAAILPLRQGMTPLFVPLVHVTLEGEGQRALARSFVIGTPSANGAGRVHPIPLDQPPGTIAGLVAQSITIPAVSAAA